MKYLLFYDALDRDWLLRHCAEAEDVPRVGAMLLVHIVNNSRVCDPLAPASTRLHGP